MELLDIWDQYGQPTHETMERNQVHREGLWHQTVHIWITSPEGKILIQQRAADRDTNPSCWDISAAGHISAGQTPIEAALREVHEEVGIKLKKEDLSYIGRVKHQYEISSVCNNEFQELFHGQINEDTPLLPQESEVSQLRWMDLKEFWNWVDSGSHPLGTLVTHPLEYQLMRSYLNGDS